MNEYDEYIGNYNIYDCVVGKNLIGLLTREQNKPLSEIELTKLVIIKLNTDNKFSYNAYYYLQHFPDMKGCLVPHPDNPGIVLTSSNAQVFFSGFIGDSAVNELESDIANNQVGRINNVRHISGKAYAVTTLREVFRRDDASQWVNISKQICEDEALREEVYERGGFSDIDGFSECDIYAAGLDGDCWHYNGSAWSRVDLPINTDIDTVCCAEDGYVYLGGSMETIVKGLGNNWKILQQKESNSSIRKIVSFKNDIYISTFDNLYVLSNDELENINHIIDCGYLATNTQKTHLVTGGSTAVHLFNGESWREVICKPE